MNDSFYPPMVNRAVVLVIPKQPFYDWDKTVFPDTALMEVNRDEYNSYLIKDSILPFEPQKALKNDWQWIFENELFGICTDESTWPEKRTWKLFNEWFELKFSTVILDLVDQPILKEKDEL